jgi:hypothetical protein
MGGNPFDALVVGCYEGGKLGIRRQIESGVCSAHSLSDIPLASRASHGPMSVFRPARETANNTAAASNLHDTRISSPHAIARLCVTIGRYWYLFKRLTPVSAGQFYRFEHIVSYSSFKALSKQASYFGARLLFLRQWKCLFCPGSRTKRAQPRTQDEIGLYLAGVFANINRAKTGLNTQ